MSKQVNGCGPVWLPSWLVPDNLLGMALEDYCNLHDREYQRGAQYPGLWQRYKSRRRADMRFFSSIFGEAAYLLDKDLDLEKPFPLLKFFSRCFMAGVYFTGVRLGGWLSYSWRSGRKEQKENRE